MGVIFMQMFFAASGAAGSIRLVIQQAPSLFLFSFVQVGIHFVSLIDASSLEFCMFASNLIRISFHLSK